MGEFMCLAIMTSVAGSMIFIDPHWVSRMPSPIKWLSISASILCFATSIACLWVVMYLQYVKAVG